MEFLLVQYEEADSAVGEFEGLEASKTECMV